MSNREKALQVADELLMEGTGFKKGNVKALPRSCYQSAKLLEKHWEYYEKGNIFPKRVIDDVVQRLKSYYDENLNEMLRNDNEKTEQLIRKSIHCG